MMITFPGNELDFNGINQDYVSQDLNDRNHDEDKIKKDMNQESLQPFIGMRFQSSEEALGYYTKYTKQKGFGPFLVDTIRVFYPSTKSNPNTSKLVELIAIEGLI
ncbi:hypothetical protein Goari_015633 [Gossypium aridum]|uniref:Uncharacterized protein n=1 Tax=Gossypium aridum TaxID=34290 RepID=A0A7J8WGC2_GOSAI|nr:hypothetical protein [Gossypium aridum]